MNCLQTVVHEGRGWEQYEAWAAEGALCPVPCPLSPSPPPHLLLLLTPSVLQDDWLQLSPSPGLAVKRAMKRATWTKVRSPLRQPTFSDWPRRRMKIWSPHPDSGQLCRASLALGLPGRGTESGFVNTWQLSFFHCQSCLPHSSADGNLPPSINHLHAISILGSVFFRPHLRPLPCVFS